MLKLGLVCILRIMVAPLRIQVVLIPNKCSFSILTFAESIGVLFGQFTRKVFSLFSLMWPIFIFTNSCVCVQRETIIAAHWQLCFICNAWAASICSQQSVHLCVHLPWSTLVSIKVQTPDVTSESSSLTREAHHKAPQGQVMGEGGACNLIH